MKMALVCFTIMMAVSCTQNRNSTQEQRTKSEDTIHYFQLAQYIQKQIEEVQKTPYFIYKIEITNGVKDSSAINTPLFARLAQGFIKADISKNEIKNQYVENIFHDQTTKTFTISYTTQNKDLEVQNIDILLEEDGLTVRRIFIRKFLNESGNSVIEQLSWKADESLQINRLVQLPGNKENSKQTLVVWNPKN